MANINISPVRIPDSRDYYESVKSAIKGLFPIEGSDGKKLELTDIEIPEAKLPSFEEMHQYKINRSTLTVPVTGTLKLIKDGKVIDSKKVRLANIPQFLIGSNTLHHGTFLINGNEYVFPTQVRLKPGVYTHFKENGELESHFNTRKGWSLRVFLNPTTRRFEILLGNHTLSLYTILKSLGAPDSAIEKVWGKELFDINSKINVENEQSKFYSIINQKKPIDPTEGIRDWFSKIDVGNANSLTESTFGKSIPEDITPEKGGITWPVLLAASERILAILNGKAKADDRNDLKYKSFHNIISYARERLELPTIRNTIIRKYKNGLEHSDKISEIHSSAIIGKPFNGLFTETSLSRLANNLNPASIFSDASVVTAMAEGGISSPYMVAASARSVHPSHFGVLDPIFTPESEDIGVVNHITEPVFIDSKNNKLYIEVLDIKTKEPRLLEYEKYVDTPIMLYDAKPKNGNVKAIKHGEIVEIPLSQIKFQMSSPDALASLNTNLIPFLNSTSALRAMMGAKMMTQAVPLINREPPKVSNHLITGESYDEAVGRDFSIIAPDTGVIEKVTEKEIVIKPKSGKPISISIPHYLPGNGDAFLKAEPIVKVGDVVKKGDVIADSNFTKNGVLALGTHLKTAYIPIEGHVFEDSTIISESAAKKLTSGRLKEFSLDYTPEVILDRSQFATVFPSALTVSNLNKLDKSGVIKVGEVVEPGDVIIAAFKKYQPTERDLKLRAFTKRSLIKFINESVKWPYSVKGKVTDVAILPKEIRVFIYMEEPAQVGDKITTRYGSKMLISKILPDDKMPKLPDGSHVELMFNPISMVNRTIPSLLFELAASKVKGYKPVNFVDTDHLQKITELAKKQGVKLNEDVTYKDHVIKNVPVGEQYVLKLEHIANDKISARYRDGYDSNLSPVTGGSQGAKSVDLLTVYSLLAGNAKANLDEMGMIKAEKNDDFWHAIEMGQTPPPPHTLFATTKFEALLRNAGINLQKDGTRFRLMPITDKITDQLSHGKIESAKVVFSDLSEEPGGLYDKKITGGINGKNWAHIELAEPVPNPILKPVLLKLLNLTNDQYNGLIDHTYYINGKTGAQAFKELLGKIKLEFIEPPKDKKVSLEQLDAINRYNRFIAGLKETGTKPEELLIKKIPVLPPVFRPIGVLPNGNISHSDFTYLYRDIIMRNNLINKLPTNLPEKTKSQLYSKLYQSVEALYGLSDPVGNYFGLHKPKGVLDIVATSPPKEAYFRKRMLSRTQDLVGRSVIIPDASLHPDEVGLPFDMAAVIFQPFVMRKLIQSGMKPLEAKKAIEKRTPIFRTTLENVAKERTVLINRAPSLHKWNVVAYKPRIVPGDAIMVPPLTVAMYGGDFDGDAVTVHVPVTEAALKESYNLLPSRAFYHPGKDSTWMTPTNEAALGIFEASKIGETKNKSYKSFDDAFKAWKKSEIAINDKVTIGGKLTTVGQLWLSKIIPGYDGRELTKKNLGNLLKELLLKNPTEGMNVLTQLKNLGDEVAMHYTVTLEDLAPPNVGLKPTSFNLKALEEYAKKADQAILANKGIIGDLARSQSIKGINQLRQILVGPVTVEDNTGRIFNLPLTTGYNQGLDLSQYWGTTFGARKGAVDRKIEVSEPGALANELLALSQDYTITEKDCGTHRGIYMSIDNNEILDYVPVKDVVVKGRTIVKRNEILTAQKLEDLKKHGIQSIEVRTPLTCEAKEGVCSYCHGPEGGKFLEVGDHVGIRNAQFMAEPATQLTLSAFHTQGVVGAQTMNKGLTRLKNIFGMQPDFLGRAQIAKEDGIVKRIIKRPEGTTEVHINDKVHLLPAGVTPLVKEGQPIKKGTPINEGMVSPLDIYEVHGLLPARQHIAEELKKTYAESGINVRRRVFDTIAKAFTNRAKIIDPGDAENKFPGDFITVSFAENFNKTPILVDREKAKGRIDPNTGSEIDLKRIKDKKVLVLPKPIIYEPYLKSLESVALAKEDWLSRLSFRHLKNTLQEGVIRHWVSDLNSPNPIPKYALNFPLSQQKGVNRT